MKEKFISANHLILYRIKSVTFEDIQNSMCGISRANSRTRFAKSIVNTASDVAFLARSHTHGVVPYLLI